MKKMQLTESQARRAIRKWLFEYTTDSGVSHRASTDDSVAGKLGDDREDQPASAIPDEIPIMAMSQMSTQLTHEMPAIEDADFIPGTTEELGRSADAVAQQVPHSEIEWFYDKIKEVAEEAIENGNKVDLTDGLLDDEKNLETQIQPKQKASQESSEASNETWKRWGNILSEGLTEARKAKKNTWKYRQKLSPSDYELYRPDTDDDWLTDDTEDKENTDSTGGLRGSSMGGEEFGGEYFPSQEDLEDMSAEMGQDIDELPGFDRDRHRTNQEVVQSAPGEEAKLRELVNLKIFPNITTMSGMRKMIKNNIDPVVHIWFVANDLSRQMAQFIQSSAGQYMFFDALTCSKLFTEDNVLELKGAKEMAAALIAIKYKKKKMPAKYKKKLAVSGKFMRSEAEAFATTTDPVSGKTMSELISQYDDLKEQNRKVLMDSGLYSAVMSNIVVAPILRKWAKEIKDGNIDLSSSKNKGQVEWGEAGEWIETEVKGTWNKMGNKRKGGKVEQAMTSQMEFHDALEVARDEAEFKAMELESEGIELIVDDTVNVEDL